MPWTDLRGPSLQLARLDVAGNALVGVTKVADGQGICHQLANDDRLDMGEKAMTDGTPSPFNSALETGVRTLRFSWPVTRGCTISVGSFSTTI